MTLPSAPRRGPWIAPGIIAVVVVAFGALTAHLVEAYQSLPAEPTKVKLADLAADLVAQRAWVEVTDGALACNVVVAQHKKTYVPLVSIDGPQLFAVVELGPKTLCPTLQLPLRATLSSSGSLADELRGQLGASYFQRDALLKPEPDAKGEAAIGAVFSLLLMTALVLLESWLVLHALRTRKRDAPAGLAGVTSSTAVPASGDVDMRVRGIDASPFDAFLPAGPLRLTAAAERRGKLARAVGMPLFALGALACAWSAGHVVVDVALDRFVWERGTLVDAQVKGEVTRYQAIIVDTDLVVAWLPKLVDDDDVSRQPNVDVLGRIAPREAHDSYLTWFVGPGNEAGRVRALGDRIAVEAAVEAWPWRIPNIFVMLGFAALLAYCAKSAWKNAAKLETIARDPELVEVALHTIQETRVNGTHTGWSCHGFTDDNEAITFALPTSTPPSRLVLLDAAGNRVLIARAKSTPKWLEPVLDDLWPFEVTREERAKAQAVLVARGSSTTLS